MPPRDHGCRATRVQWVGHGNSRAAIRPFFEQLGERCQQIEAVAMDMNTAFDLEVKQHCPQADGPTCSTWWLAMAERWWTGCGVEQANALKAINRREKWSKCALVAAT